jgi:hypothetical protein
VDRMELPSTKAVRIWARFWEDTQFIVPIIYA